MNWNRMIELTGCETIDYELISYEPTDWENWLITNDGSWATKYEQYSDSKTDIPKWKLTLLIKNCLH